MQAITLALTINALPTLEVRQGGTNVCQITDGSPYSDNITATINQLYGKSGADYLQINQGGGNCSIVVCGDNIN